MTVTATLSQNGTSVNLPIKGERANPLIAVDYGKPHLVEHNNGGSEFKRVQDRWSGLQQFNLLGFFRGSNAYQDAIDLVELIHSDGGGNSMILDIPGIGELESNIKVAPSAESPEALTLNFQPGRKNFVSFELGLTRIDTTLGSYNRTITTPTATGTGPIELSNNGTTVALETDVNVTRSVGRPNDVIRKNTRQYPRYEVKRKIVADQFDISLLFVDSPTTTTNEIANLFSTRLGRTGVTLDFNGLFGLGSFNVVPSGTQALRHVRDAGKGDISIIPQLAVERISV